MTEGEWPGFTTMRQVLDFLRTQVGARKPTLFGCTCCRLIWESLPDDNHRAFVAMVEDQPEKNLDDPGLSAALAACTRREEELPGNPGYLAVKYLGTSATAPAHVPWHAGYVCAVPFYVVRRMRAGRYPTGGMPAPPELEPDIREVLNGLLRDIFPNPSRPVTLNPAWLTYSVQALAQGMYADRAFDRMPILGDALEEAGCTEAAVLEHCRMPAEHVRGCWLVDAVLGRE